MAIKMIDGTSFEETINSGDLVLVDFFATWCGPCKMLGPILEEISGELPAGRAIAKLDIDENVPLARKFGVMSVPTMVFFKDGKALGKMIGLQEKQDILNAFDKVAAM